MTPESSDGGPPGSSLCLFQLHLLPSSSRSNHYPDVFDHSLFPPQFYHLVLESLNSVFQFCMFFTSKQMELSCVYSFLSYFFCSMLFCKIQPCCCSLFFIAEQYSIVEYTTIYLFYCSFLFVFVFGCAGSLLLLEGFLQLQ